MDSEGVSLPLIHKHVMMPWNDLRKGDCCGLFEAISDGYFCKSCDFFVHKKCSDHAPESIEHPFHSIHTLQLLSKPGLNRCDVCRKRIVDLFYRCDECVFDIDLFCAKYPPPEVIDISETHHHKLTLLKKRIKEFDCDAKCGKADYDGLPYKCHECDLAFHVDCVWHGSEVNKHPLEIDERLFYHCSSCNFTLDLRCVLNPPQRSLLNLKTHDHHVTPVIEFWIWDPVEGVDRYQGSIDRY